MVINRGTSVPVSTCQTEQNWTRLPLGALIGPQSHTRRRTRSHELVVDRDRVYEINGEDSRALAAVGAFRIVPEHALDRPHDTLENLHDQGLVELVDLGDTGRGLTLTTEGRDLLDSHSLERDGEPSQVFHTGVSRSREMDHDSNLYATFRQPTYQPSR
jgi:hypothetical protein